MAKSPQIKSRISTIAKELANGKERADILRKFAKKWGVAEKTLDRYIQNAKVEANSLRKLAEQTANDIIVEETTEAVKKGLKSKLDRVLLLQKQVDDIQADLDAGITVDYVILQGKLQKVNKEISVTDKAYMRKTIKDIQAEISKIEGDYAPEKREVTGKDGQDLNKGYYDLIRELQTKKA